VRRWSSSPFLDNMKQSPYLHIQMIYVRIPEKHDAKGFLLLAKSGAPVSCLPGNIYGVTPEHVKTLKRKRIPFKQVPAKSIHLPKSSLAA
jgi:hypothetical protein